MKRYFTKILLAFCLITSFVFVGCSNNKDELLIKKIEISKVSFDSEETFDTSKMKTEKTWTFEDSKSIKLIFGTVTGNFEPQLGKPNDKDYNIYYVKIFHDENSIEKWIFWLDKKFSKDGVAENKENKGRYISVSMKDVVKIGQLLKK